MVISLVATKQDSKPNLNFGFRIPTPIYCFGLWLSQHTQLFDFIVVLSRTVNFWNRMIMEAIFIHAEPP